MKHTAKQWSVTIRILDAMAVSLTVFIGWLMWSFYRLNGEIALPIGFLSLLGIASFFVLRGIATKEKRKAAMTEGPRTADHGHAGRHRHSEE